MNWQKIRLWLAVLALIALSVSGFWGVDQEWRFATHFAEQFSACMQTVYSVLGLLAVPALFWRLGWSRPLLYLWAFALLLTGATAPLIWGGNGWWAGFFAACMMAVVAGLVIWLAPLPAPGASFARWRWAVVGGFGVAALVVLSVTARTVLSAASQIAPVALGGEHMEQFCAGMRQGITHDQLRTLVESQGYTSADTQDAKGAYLRIQDPAAPGSYHCEVRFKPDGSLASINFTAKPD